MLLGPLAPSAYQHVYTAAPALRPARVLMLCGPLALLARRHVYTAASALRPARVFMSCPLGRAFLASSFGDLGFTAASALRPARGFMISHTDANGLPASSASQHIYSAAPASLPARVLMLRPLWRACTASNTRVLGFTAAPALWLARGVKILRLDAILHAPGFDRVATAAMATLPIQSLVPVAIRGIVKGAARSRPVAYAATAQSAVPTL